MSKREKNVWTKELSWREHIVRDRKKTVEKQIHE